MRILFFCLLMPVCTIAQVAHTPFSSAYIGFTAYSKSFIDPFSFTANPAALAQVKGVGVAVYGERPFLLKELSRYSGVVAFPFKSGGGGIALHYYGDKNYSRSQLGLAYGKKLSDKVAIGIQFNYYRVSIIGYGNASTINGEAGSSIQVTPKVKLGVRMVNPIGGKLGKEDGQRLASITAFGIGYEVSEKVFLKLEINKEEDIPVQINPGIQYIIKEQIFLRLGILANTGSLCLGSGIKWKNIRIDISANYHPQLGVTPGFMFMSEKSKGE